MKRILALLLCVALAISLLSGCGGARAARTKSIDYAQSNTELLRSCARELQDAVSERVKETGDRDYFAFRVEPAGTPAMRLYNTVDETETTLQSELCHQVFNSGLIDYISIYVRSGICAVVFATGGYGIGPATGYYAIEYVSSGEVRDLWWYSDKLEFAEQEDGVYGREIGGDNTFFYHQITEDLYYCEATF